MTASPYIRRAILVLCACVLSAPFLRVPLGEALLARGDGALTIGRQGMAWRFYERAEAIDGSRTPLQRIVTLALLSNDPAIVRKALGAVETLKPTKRVASLFFERALLEWRNHQSFAAERDSRISWILTPSIEPLLFAGILARRRGAIKTAIDDFQRAHRLVPGDPRPLYQLRRWAR